MTRKSRPAAAPKHNDSSVLSLPDELARRNPEVFYLGVSMGKRLAFTETRRALESPLADPQILIVLGRLLFPEDQA